MTLAARLGALAAAASLFSPAAVLPQAWPSGLENLRGDAWSQSLGEGAAAALRGLGAVDWNPAGLAGLPSMGLALSHSQWGDLAARQRVAGAAKLGGVGVLGLSLASTRSGGLEIRDSLGNLLGLEHLSHSRASALWAVQAWGGLQMGLELGAWQDQGPGFSQQGLATGGGLAWENRRVRAALAGHGSVDGSWDLEAALRASLVRKGAWRGDFLVGTLIRNRDSLSSAGAEISWADAVFARGSWTHFQKENALHPGGQGSLGGGLRWRGWDLGYAYSPLGPVGDSHWLELRRYFDPSDSPAPLDKSAATPVPTATPTPLPRATPTPSATATPTPLPTATPTPAPAPTPRATPTSPREVELKFIIP